MASSLPGSTSGLSNVESPLELSSRGQSGTLTDEPPKLHGRSAVSRPVVEPPVLENMDSRAPSPTKEPNLERDESAATTTNPRTSSVPAPETVHPLTQTSLPVPSPSRQSGPQPLTGNTPRDPDSEPATDLAAAPPPPPLPSLPTPGNKISRALTFRLYISHFLSTWNSRVFEFTSTLFLAHIYPGTLLPLSVYAICRAAAAILLSQVVGWAIDHRSRLSVVRTTIVVQRLAVAVSCAILVVLERGVLDRKRQAGAGREISGSGFGQPSKGGRVKDGLFAILTVLACLEKLASIGNLVTVERDWVVVMTQDNEGERQKLNARLRRLDLTCKLVGPLIIALIDGASPSVAIWTVFAMNMASVLPEYIFISRVFHMTPALDRARKTTHLDLAEGAIELSSQNAAVGEGAQVTTKKSISPSAQESKFRSVFYNILPISSFPLYFRHRAFLPSFALSLLYLTVLAFAGQMVAFLVSVGYTSFVIGGLRTIGTVFELSATWLAPRLMKRIGPIRAGLWFITWQMFWLAAGMSWLFSHSGQPQYKVRPGGSMATSIFTASGLVGGVVLSRMGLWGFDLCAQLQIQDAVEEPHRGAFSSTEAAFHNVFELLAFASTLVFSRPDQFQWPVVISVSATFLAGGFYAVHVRRSRGHLLPFRHLKLFGSAKSASLSRGYVGTGAAVPEHKSSGFATG